MNKKKVSFLISGKGSNLYKILIKNLEIEKFYIISIVSNNLISDEIKKIVKKNEYKINLFEKVPSLKSNYFKGTDVIFSLGYMKIINSKLIDKYTIINLHPSILPKYKGLMTQKRILINNEKEYGFTIHKVSNDLDSGDIISQKRKKISNFNELETLKAHKKLEHQFVYKKLIDYLY